MQEPSGEGYDEEYATGEMEMKTRKMRMMKTMTSSELH
jgi:hypothetical protein